MPYQKKRKTVTPAARKRAVERDLTKCNPGTRCTKPVDCDLCPKECCVEDRVMEPLWNPFTKCNHNPKWPDGKTAVSFGRQSRATTVVTAKEFYVILFAGINNWCQVYQKVTNEEGEDVLDLLENHSTEKVAPFAWNYTNPIQGVGKFRIPTNAVASWRPVSVGLRISDATKENETKGYWRASRIHGNATEVFVATGVGPETPEVRAGNIVPGPGIINRNLSTNEIFSTTSKTSTGSLEDLGKKRFVLNNVNSDNDFRPLTGGYRDLKETAVELAIGKFPRYRLTDVTTPFNGNPDPVGASDPKTPFDRLVRERDMFLHPGWDMIVVQCVSPQEDPYLRVDSVCNQEFQLDETNANADVATRAYNLDEELQNFVAYRNSLNSVEESAWSFMKLGYTHKY